MNSLTISNKIPSFFHFGFKWELHQNIRFEYFHGKLKSGIIDTNIKYYDEVSRPFDIVRNIVAHRLEWQPRKWIIFSGSELVTYANRSIEIGLGCTRGNRDRKALNNFSSVSADHVGGDNSVRRRIHQELHQRPLVTPRQRVLHRSKARFVDVDGRIL